MVDDADSEDQVTVLRTTQLPSMPPLRRVGTVVGEVVYVTTHVPTPKGSPIVTHHAS